MRIPFLKLPASQPQLRGGYQRRLAAVLSRGQFILGREVAAFEREFAASCGARFAIGVANGTEAIQIALRISGVQPGAGHEVITTPLTASFTAHAIVAAGATPVFADIDPHTLLLSPEAAAARVGKNTAAVIPVHLYGRVCDLERFRKLARETGRPLIQDAAQAHGATYKGRPLSRYSELSTFSFYPTKNLGAAGDGGAIVTDSEALDRAARLFRNGGRREGHVASCEAINSRLDELQAALLRMNLRRLKRWNEARRRMAAYYSRLLADARPGDLVAPPEACCVHLYVVRTSTRDRLREHLARRGIETAIHYELPLHLHPAFQRFGYKRGDFPNAERAAAQVLSLPLHPFLTRSEAERVVAEVVRFFRQ